MHRFWQWLVHTDARKIRSYSLLCLALTVAWWVWQLFAPTSTTALAQHDPPVWQPRTRIGALEFIEQQLALGTAMAGNPFIVSNPIQRRRALRSTQSWQSRFQRPPAQNTTPPTTGGANSNAGRNPNRNKPRMVTLIYHGMMVRTDGAKAALLENRGEGTRLFYSHGSAVAGCKLGNISSDQVEITFPDGSLTMLKAGVAATFREAPNDN